MIAPPVDLEVVLQVSEVHPLAQIGDERVDEGVRAPRAEHEIGKIVGRLIRGGPTRPAELSAVRVAAVLRMEIVDLRVDRLVLVPRLEAFRPLVPRGLIFGLKRVGSWNCGLLFWRPNVVHPEIPCSVSPPENLGSVGSPLIPYSSCMLGRPSSVFLPASVRENPRRTSSSDSGVTVKVKPPAN